MSHEAATRQASIGAAKIARENLAVHLKEGLTLAEHFGADDHNSEDRELAAASGPEVRGSE